MIKINLEDTYNPKYVNNEFTYFIFDSELADKTIIELHVVIEQHTDQYLPNVYNLGFGPPDGKGSFNDKFKAKHKDTNKLFSTVLLYGIIVVR